MGKSIVYCDGCGKRLFEEDFTSQKAHSVDDRPFCTDCKPVSESPAPSTLPPTTPMRATPRPGHLSTDRIPTSRRERKPDTTRRQTKGSGGKGGLLLGIGGAVFTVILLVALLSGGGSKDPSPKPPSPPPRVESRKKETKEASRPDKPLPKKVTEESARDIEKKMAEEARKAKAARLDRFLAEIQKTIDRDAGFLRTPEIEKMIASALSDAGPRRAEVEALRTKYHARMEAARETIGHFTFEDLSGKTTSRDSSSAGREATFTKGFTVVPGKFGRGVHFDGVAGAGIVEKIDGLSPHAGPDGKLTVSVWVKLDPKKAGDKTISAPVVAKGRPGAWEYAIYIWSSGSAGMTVWQLGGSNYTSVAGAKITEDTWHHVACVLHKGKYLRVYVDGSLKVEQKEFKGDTGAGTSPLYFGRRGDGKYFKGAIDDVRIYGRALSASEIKKLAGAGR